MNYILPISFITIIISLTKCLFCILNIKNDIFQLVLNIWFILAILFSLYYIFTGYRKSGAKLYKYVLLFSAISEAGNAAKYLSENEPYLALVNLAIIGLYLLLAFFPDLGEQNSYSLCSLALIIKLMFIVELIQPSIDLTSILLNRNTTMFLIAVITLICTWAKYTDKKNRGTK